MDHAPRDARASLGGQGSVTKAPPGSVTDRVTIVPANKASWEDLQTILGARGYAARCQCQWFKTPGYWGGVAGRETREEQLREQTACGNPRARTTSGLVAYLDGEPVGWCAVEPRPVYRRILGMKGPWAGRDEDKADDSVWAVTCFIVRLGYRRRGITYALARAAVDFARKRGARALEGYPMITRPDKEITWGELHVGSRNVFTDAGFTQVTHPSPRRVVMRIDFTAEKERHG
jgi:GNAT superfamily N-acetyltransferase